MLASPGCVDHHLAMQVIGNANIDHIDFFVLQHLAVITIRVGDAALLGKFRGVVRAGDCHDFGILHPTFEGSVMNVADKSGANNADFYGFVSWQSSSVIQK